jgi:glycosyltransferase involved in cell wall biosynthesis
MTASVDRSLTVVIPAQNAAGLLDDCLASVMPQLQSGDQVIVVDDASEDTTSLVAEAAGADVIRLSESHGPYAARQRAADHSESWAIVFVDARCRVRPGWLESHRELLSRAGTALSCSGVLTVAGRPLATRVAAYVQPFRFDATLRGHRLPYFPTCNLGVLRAAFEHVGGFTNVRSGGDADLCWRVQDAGLGEIAVDYEMRVEWVPRERVRELASQMSRYGQSSAGLISAPGPGMPGIDWRQHARAVRDDLYRRRASPVVILVAYAILAGQRGAYAWRRVARRSP